MKQAILCGKLLNTVKKRVDTDQVILVEDDRIQAVERREAIEIPEGYEIVDCSDRFVTPGLIDAHLHTAFDPMTYLKDYTGDGVIRGLINAKKDLLALPPCGIWAAPSMRMYPSAMPSTAARPGAPA